EHSAEYQSQALIDLARRLGPKIGDLSRVESIVILTSHHTHYVIGTGAGDPQKMDPMASRETLDCTFLPWRSRTVRGTTSALMPLSEHHDPQPWRSGTRSSPSKTPNGRAAITVATPGGRRSVVASW